MLYKLATKKNTKKINFTRQSVQWILFTKFASNLWFQKRWKCNPWRRTRQTPSDDNITYRSLQVYQRSDTQVGQFGRTFVGHLSVWSPTKLSVRPECLIVDTLVGICSYKSNHTSSFIGLVYILTTRLMWEWKPRQIYLQTSEDPGHG